MAINRPFKRIYRPFVYGSNDSIENPYATDPRYSPDRIDLVRGYHLIEKELLSVFEYIEPTDANLDCYSHRLYALLLRAATEFEANARAILLANGYSPRSNLKIADFHKINATSRLSEYEVTIPIWSGSHKRFTPLLQWNVGSSLTWYQGYNATKHNRAFEFHQASLRNTIYAVASVFSILFSQFHVHSFDPHHTVGMINSDGEEVWTHEAALLGVRVPSSWQPSEKYDFSWEALRSSPEPFDVYPF